MHKIEIHDRTVVFVLITEQMQAITKSLSVFATSNIINKHKILPMDNLKFSDVNTSDDGVGISTSMSIKEY